MINNIKLYIIRIKDNENSVKVAERCYNSFMNFYSDYAKLLRPNTFEYFDAITPKDEPVEILKKEGITKLNGFIEPYSRWDNVIAAFTSHFSLWKKCILDDRPFIIFEHDAVLVNSLPIIKRDVPISNSAGAPTQIQLAPHHLLGDIVNLGHPSYGKFNTPPVMGINPLTSKQYFPGAHAYYITPKGASQLIEKAKTEAGPTDVFIHNKRFKNLQEWYPWSAVAKDSFSTIQNEKGCLAKHNYNSERYKLVQVR